MIDDYVTYAPGRSVFRPALLQSTDLTLNLFALLAPLNPEQREAAQRVLYDTVFVSQEDRDRIAKRLAQLDAILL